MEEVEKRWPAASSWLRRDEQMIADPLEKAADLPIIGSIPFQPIFENTMDPVFLVTRGRFADCNKPAIDILKASKKEDILGLRPDELSPEFQPDGEPSRQKAKRIAKETVGSTNCRFEWVHREYER
jgi:PAS domain-containing protein